MKGLTLLLASMVCGTAFSLSAADSNVIIAQISDTHLGEKHSPDAAAHLREALEMINARHPDAVIVSGDLGENSAARAQVQSILKASTAPVYYVPGNHDITDTNGLARYRKQFGRDYYSFQVKDVELLALDSELLGNYKNFAAKTVMPLPPGMETETQKMLIWLGEQAGATTNRAIIAVQHIPLFRDKNFPDAKPYWTINPPYAQQEMELLKKLGVKHLLAGHWHNARVFEQDGLTIHAAPATSWLPMGGQLGFAIHTITPEGDVHTQFVALSKETPSATP